MSQSQFTGDKLYVHRIYPKPVSQGVINERRRLAEQRYRQNPNRQTQAECEAATCALSRQELDKMSYIGTPILFEHGDNDPSHDTPTLSGDPKYTAGVVVKSEVEPDGSQLTYMRPFDTPEGYNIRMGMESGTMRGVSIGHSIYPDGRRILDEISVCYKGKVPGTGLVRIVDASSVPGIGQNDGWIPRVYKQILQSKASVLSSHGRTIIMSSDSAQSSSSNAQPAAAASVNVPVSQPTTNIGTGTTSAAAASNGPPTATAIAQPSVDGKDSKKPVDIGSTSAAGAQPPDPKRQRTDPATADTQMQAQTQSGEGQEEEFANAIEALINLGANEKQIAQIKRAAKAMERQQQQREATHARLVEMQRKMAEQDARLTGAKKDTQRAMDTVHETLSKFAKVVNVGHPDMSFDFLKPTEDSERMTYADFATRVAPMMSQASFLMDHGAIYRRELVPASSSSSSSSGVAAAQPQTQAVSQTPAVQQAIMDPELAQYLKNFKTNKRTADGLTRSMASVTSTTTTTTVENVAPPPQAPLSAKQRMLESIAKAESEHQKQQHLWTKA